MTISHQENNSTLSSTFKNKKKNSRVTSLEFYLDFIHPNEHLFALLQEIDERQGKHIDIT